MKIIKKICWISKNDCKKKFIIIIIKTARREVVYFLSFSENILLEANNNKALNGILIISIIIAEDINKDSNDSYITLLIDIFLVYKITYFK